MLIFLYCNDHAQNYSQGSKLTLGLDDTNGAELAVGLNDGAKLTVGLDEGLELILGAELTATARESCQCAAWSKMQLVMIIF